MGCRLCRYMWGMRCRLCRYMCGINEMHSVFMGD